MLLYVCFTGARVQLKNNDGKTPYSLAKDPETAALLQHIGIICNFIIEHTFIHENISARLKKVKIRFSGTDCMTLNPQLRKFLLHFKY